MQQNSEYEISIHGRHGEMLVGMNGTISISDIFEVTRQLMKIMLDRPNMMITENMFILGLVEHLKDPRRQDFRIDMNEAAKQAAASGRGEDGAG